MKKIAALVETTRDRVATVKSVSTVFSVLQQHRVPSAQLKSSASNTHNKACHKAPAKVITMNVSGGNSKEIFELFTNKLVFSVSVSVPCAKYCWPAPTKDFSSQLFARLY